MIDDRRTGRRVERWVVGVCFAAAGAALVIGMGAAHADTPDDVIDQAISDVSQGTTVLDTASTADLSTRSADILSAQEALPANLDASFNDLLSAQDNLSAADQILLADVDEHLVSAAQNILSADEAFVAADQAGDLSSNGLTSADWTLIGADLDLLGAYWDAAGATILAVLTGGADTSAAADLASSLDPATAVDPSIFADVLSSLGL